MAKGKSNKKAKQQLIESKTPSRQILSKKSTLAVGPAAVASPVLLPLPFPSHLPRPDNHDFLLNQAPYRESYQAALKTSYEGFVVDDQVDMEEVVVQRCLEDLKDYFRRDVTQPFGLGTKCAKTYVTRCLVGDPGTTYKYLGLRMFAHPWKSPTGSTLHHQGSDSTGKSSSALTQTMATTKTIFQLGHLLSERTKHHLGHLDEQRQRRGAPLTQGRSIFDICLINRMDPTEKLKHEPSSIFSNLQTSVSWHADSSLEHYSTIAVYQTLLQDPSQQQKGKVVKHTSPNQDQWYVAMRVTPHCEGPTVGTLKQKANIQSTVDQTIPPIAASLPSGSAYYLLDDFNHHHQHTVLLAKEDPKNNNSNNKPIPSWIRYSCTFRLLRDSHNVEYMLRRCQSVISQFHKKGMKIWRSEQLLLTEIESEWIRQFYIQGSQHYDLLWEPFWKEPIEALVKYWSQLEHRTQQTCELLQLAAQAKCHSTSPRIVESSSLSSPPTKAERKARDKQKKALAAVESLLERSTGTEDTTNFFDAMADLLEERSKMRELWTKREKDHVFTELAPELRPIPLPFQFCDSEPPIQARSVISPLPGNPVTLRDLAASLRLFGKAFHSGQDQDLPPTVGLTQAMLGGGQLKDHDDSHSEPQTWKGWNDPHLEFGLEIQDPWATAVLNGTKQIETRTYELPTSLIGRRIWILKSPPGTVGVSAVGNDIDLSNPGSTCVVVGWCTFSSIFHYSSKVAFRHLVSHESGYGWKDGTTNIIYGWW